MTGFIARRIAWLIITATFVSIVAFVGTHALPGSMANAILGNQASPADIARVTHELGLDRPIAVQYLSWMAGLLHGELGNSLANGQPLSALLATPFVNSAILVAITALIAFPAAAALGVWTATKNGRLADEASGAVLLTLVSVPQFAVAILLIVLLSTGVLHLLPAVSTIPFRQTALSNLPSVILPAITLIVTTITYLSRLVRASAIEVLESDYVTMARLRGVHGRRLFLRHVIPNAIIPAISASVVTVTYLFGGIVVVEVVFNYPGIGRAFVEAVLQRNVPEVQLVATVLAILYLVLNLVGDVFTVLATPRIRTELH